MGGTAYAGRIRVLGATLRKKNERKRARTDKSVGGVTCGGISHMMNFWRLFALT